MTELRTRQLLVSCMADDEVSIEKPSNSRAFALTTKQQAY
jgi:hypothetical protein